MKNISFVLLLFFANSCILYQKDSTDVFSNLSKIKNNQIIEIRDGVYRDINISIKDREFFKVVAKNPGKVIVTGECNFEFKRCSNFEISGIYFREANSKELISLNNCKKSLISNNLFEKCTGGRYASLIGLNNNSYKNIIANNSFDGNATIGIAIKDGNTHNEIFYNLFRNVPSVRSLFPNSDGNGMECVQLGRGKEVNGCSLVSHNYFENIDGDGAEIISIKSNKNEVCLNYFENSKGGVTVRIGNYSVIRNNTFINTSHPIRIFGENHKVINNYVHNASVGIQFPAGNAESSDKNKLINSYSISKDIEVYGNTIKDTKTPVLIGNGYSENRFFLPVNLTIQNNNFNQQNWLEVNSDEVYRKNTIMDNCIKCNSEIPTFSIKKVGVNWSR